MILPDHPEKFARGWLAEKLGAPADALMGFDFTPIGTGQVGDSYRLVLDWRDAAGRAPSIVAKCPAADAQSRATGQALHNYEMEVRWYQNMAEACAARTPHCYYAEIDDSGGEFVLLMEDVSPAIAGDQIAGGTGDAVRDVLDELAHLHGFKWQAPELAEIAWLNFGAGNSDFVRDFLPRAYPEWCARYRERIDAAILEMGAALVARLAAYLAPYDTPRTITHGDARLDNILFSDAAGRAILVDWQTVSAGAPMGDVAYLLGTSFADPDARAATEEKLVAHYLERLAAYQTVAYPYERAWHDYRRNAFAGFLMGVIAAMLVARTARGDEMFAVMAERAGYQALHLDSLALI